MAASVEGTATCSPALQTLSLMQARHTISPPYFNQRLSTCQQWENNLRRTLKRIIALLHGFKIRLCAQQTSYQLICRNSLLSWRVTVDWRNSLVGGRWGPNCNEPALGGPSLQKVENPCSSRWVYIVFAVHCGIEWVHSRTSTMVSNTT